MKITAATVPSAATRRTILSALTTVPALLAACSPGASGARGGDVSPAAVAGGKPVTIEYWGNPPPAEGKNFQMDVFDTFRTKFPNVTINYGATKTDFAGSVSTTLMTTAIVGGSPPNFVRFDRATAAAFAAKQVWFALDDVIKRDKYDMGRFAPLIIPEVKGIPDGKWVGLIQTTNTRMLFWNKDAFQEAGLDPEKPPATWDELRDMSVKLTNRKGDGTYERVGSYLEFAQSQYQLHAWQNGGGFQTPDGKKATFPDAKNQEALQWRVDIVKQLGGYDRLEQFRATWNTSGTNAQNAQHPFLVRQLAMIYEEIQLASTMGRFGANVKFGVVHPPVRKAGDKPLTWSGGHGYNLIKGTKDPDATWELMKYLVSEEGHEIGDAGDAARTKQIGGFFVPGMSGQPELDKKRYAKYKSGIAAVDRVAEVGVPLMQYSRVREPSLANDAMWPAVSAAQKEAVSEQKSVRQTLEDHQAIVQKALDDGWANVPK